MTQQTPTDRSVSTAPAAREAGGRVAFIDVLRALAAPIVVLGHYIVIFFTRPQLVEGFIFAPAIEAVAYPETFEFILHSINLTLAGVAAFFIISGFVIPLALEKDSWSGYIIKRVLRIYPTYIVVLAITMGFIYFSGYFWGREIPIDFWTWVQNYLLVADFYGKFDILTVAWTLQIEIKYYVLALVFFMVLRKHFVAAIIIWALVTPLIFTFGANFCSHPTPNGCWPRQANYFKALGNASMYITFMLIGSLFYAHFRKKIGTGALACLTALFYASFMYCYRWSIYYGGNMNAYFIPTMIGLTLFAVFYVYRSRIHLSPVIQFFADISYPLYLIHAVNGYIVMRLAIAYGVSYVLAFLAALVFAIGAAWTVHILVEAPSIALGKRLARKKPVNL